MSTSNSQKQVEAPNGVPLQERQLLFISYAYEDEIFAKWLARKLALHGYGVWFDQIKILGGESWVEEVDVAIKDRSFRVLGLLSQASIEKPNPRKERTKALQLAADRSEDDFLITLNLDGVKPDWVTSDISYIPFNEGWANGLRRLLKKLRSIEAPRLHAGNPAIALASLDQGDELLTPGPESLVTNWLVFDPMPTSLQMFDISGMDSEAELSSRDKWPRYGLGSGKAVSFVGPPAELSASTNKIKRAFHWPGCATIESHPTDYVVSNLLRRTVHTAFLRAGCAVSETDKAYYMTDAVGENGIYRFIDADTKRRYIRTSGMVRMYRPEQPPEVILYRPSVRTRVRHLPKDRFLVQLRPGITIFDDNGKQFVGRKVGPRVKQVTKNWWNDKWRKRLMAFYDLLLTALTDEALQELRNPTLLQLTADHSLNENPLSPSKETTDDTVSEDVVVDDNWQDDE